MEKSCQSSGDNSSVSATSDCTFSTPNNDKEIHLKNLNKLSHKISKPLRRPPPPPPAVDPSPPPPAPQQPQPSVYNISKNDFRDVVQKLTGTPAHERLPAPPPSQPTNKQPSSRLHKIRPPPLAQISSRPPGLPLNSLGPQAQTSGPWRGGLFGDQRPPFSPLPPLPTVHAAAESPISAYLRSRAAYSLTASPRWNNSFCPVPPSLERSLALPQFPATVPFGCIPSPRSPYASGQMGSQQLPVSPTVPRSSPRWKGI